jgi:hypothetical protein
MIANNIKVDHLSEADQKSFADLIVKRQDGKDNYKVLMKEYKILKACVEKVEKKFGITMEDRGEIGSTKYSIFNLAYNVRHKYKAVDHLIRMYKEWQKQYTKEFGKLRGEYIQPRDHNQNFSSLHSHLDETNGRVTKARSHVRIANNHLTYLNDTVKRVRK